MMLISPQIVHKFNMTPNKMLVALWLMKKWFQIFLGTINKFMKMVKKIF